MASNVETNERRQQRLGRRREKETDGERQARFANNNAKKQSGYMRDHYDNRLARHRKYYRNRHCEVAIIEDIGQVIDDENPQRNPGWVKVIKVEIVTVVTIDTCKSCWNCNTNILDLNTALAVDLKCNAKMKLAKCANHSVANVILEDVKATCIKLQYLMKFES